MIVEQFSEGGKVVALDTQPVAQVAFFREIGQFQPNDFLCDCGDSGGNFRRSLSTRIIVVRNADNNGLLEPFQILVTKLSGSTAEGRSR